MRKRYQRGCLRKVNRRWIAQWWQNGHHRKRTLGLASKMTKSQARLELEAILAPVNACQAPSARCSFGDFVEQIHLPFYKRKWKGSTAVTTEHRIKSHLIAEFRQRTLDSFTRDELQGLLERKAASGLSFSTVNHLRWDLKQIFKMAWEDGYLSRTPAALLFTPQEAGSLPKRRMNWKEAALCLSVLDTREHVITMLSVLAGMRPGEILALWWQHIDGGQISVRQRIYKGTLDSPKSNRSYRIVALSEGLRQVIAKWRSVCPDTSPQAWVFPSETGKTPISRENCWRRNIAPKLEEVGLGWVNFQVMRRTHATLMRELKVDPKVVADQLGHTLDVNLNVYTDSGLERKTEAVNLLEATLALKGKDWSPLM